jgi:hypothetical protein
VPDGSCRIGLPRLWRETSPKPRPRQRTAAADAGFAGIGRFRRGSKGKPIEIIMACEAGRISIGEWS